MTGQIVKSKAGHDKDTLYVIVGEKGDFYFLADGKNKTLEKPKKKRKKHVQPVKRFVKDELIAKLTNGQTVYPEEIRNSLNLVEE